MNDKNEPLSKEKKETIIDALREVYDPEIPINIVDLGLVREIEQTEDGVQITMILTAPFCPLANLIFEQTREAAQAVVDQPVEVTLGEERWAPSMMAPQEDEKTST